MAYTMTHILIAERVLDDIKTQAPIDYPTYIVGAAAPDAVHASPRYTRTLKEKSHFFPEGAVWGKIMKESRFRDWMDNIKMFYMLNHHKYDRDFLLGYMIHVLTDVFSCRQIFVPFYASLSKENFDDKMNQFREESYCVNYYLFCEYSKRKNLFQLLREGRSCSIVDVFDEKLLDDRIKQLYDFEFRPHDIEHMIYHEICTIENTNKLIEDVPKMIKSVFLDDYYTI